MPIAFVAAGAWAAGTTPIAPGLPAGMAAGHLMLLAVQTPNQVVSTPAGWTQATTSPVGVGTAAAAGATRITLFYRFWVSGDVAPSVVITGANNAQAQILGYSGVNTTTPFDAIPVATTLGTAGTALSMAAITTVSANALILWAVARDLDGNSITGVTAFTNAALTAITERVDQTVNTGVGGGLWVGAGFKAVAGATGATAITQTSSIAVGLTVALRPGANVFTRALAGSLTGAGVASKKTLRRVLGASTGAGNPRRKTITSLKIGSITASSTLAKKLIFTKLIVGTLTVAGAIRRLIRKGVFGASTAAGTVRKKTALRIASVITGTGVVGKKTFVRFAGSLAPTGIYRRLVRLVTTMRGTVAPSGTVATFVPLVSNPDTSPVVLFTFLRRYLGRR